MRWNPNSSKHIGQIIFLVLVALWILPRILSFLQPFWLADDFTMWDLKIRSVFSGSAQNGRLMDIPFILLYKLFPPPDNAMGSVIMRGLQGLLHIATAFLLWQSIRSRFGTWRSLVVVIPFLTWAFNCEATIWIGATIYPAGTFFSVLGVYLIRRQQGGSHPWLAVMGAVSLAAAVHTTQASATLGISLFCLLVMLDLLPDDDGRVQNPIRRLAVQGLWIGGGYLAGGALSYWLMEVLECQRQAEEFSWAGNTMLLLKFIQRLWTLDGFYSLFFQYYLYLLAAVAAGLALVAAFRRRLRWHHLLIMAVAWAGLSLAPFTANFLSGKPQIAMRVLYSGAITWTGLIAIGYIATGRSRRLTATVSVLGLAFFLLNMVPAWRETEDFCKTFRNDLKVLADLESYSEEVGTKYVLFVDYNHVYITITDPYGYNYPYRGGQKFSILQHPSWNYRFLLYYSDKLDVYPHFATEDEFLNSWNVLMDKYRDVAQSLGRDRFMQFQYVEPDNLILVVPR